MTSNAGCWRPRPVVLATVTSLLTGCATGGSDPRIATACPPVVEYSPEVRARAAEELGGLTDGSAIAGMLSDYSVMRDQTQLCGKTH